MARSSLTLAALATSAIAGFEPTAARIHTRRAHGEFDAAILRDASGRCLLIRVPRTQTAESEQSAELVSLRALTAGVRSRLNFTLPTVLGQAPVDDTRAVVTEYIHGTPISLAYFADNTELASSVGRAIAAIHNLPTAFVADAGLPVQSAEEARSATVDLIDEASDTGLLPAQLLRRWEETTDNDELWRFPSTVVHGSLGVESFLLSEDGAIGAVLGWAKLRVGDPASDLHWLVSSSGPATEAARVAYSGARLGAQDRSMGQRALLYAELELVKWLLHGTDTRNQAVIDDAVQMLDALVDSVTRSAAAPLASATGPILTVGDVETMLTQTPRQSAVRDEAAAMQTDSYDPADLDFSDYDPTANASDVAAAFASDDDDTAAHNSRTSASE